jgi:predicted dehydrogenase
MKSVAIIGYGAAGANIHAPLVAATRGLEICAIVTSDDDRVRQAKRDFPRVAILGSPDELWRDPDFFDVVVIAAPPTTHALLARRALQLGRAVVLEKPATLTTSELETLIALARRRDVLLSVFHNRRWDGDFLTMKGIIDSGVLGRIMRVESRWETYRPLTATWKDRASIAEGAGVLYDVGSHLIDQICLLFGEPRRVYAELSAQRARSRADDEGFLSLSFQDVKCTAHLFMSRVTTSAGPRFRVVGTHGVYVDPDDPLMRSGGTRPRTRSCMVWARGLAGEVRMTKVRRKASQRPVYYAQLRDALNGVGPVPIDAAEAIPTMRTIDAAREAFAQPQRTPHRRVSNRR